MSPQATPATEQDPTKMSCHTCPMRKRAEEKPKSFAGRLWKWHTGWCPGWKAYQKALQNQ